MNPFDFDDDELLELYVFIRTEHINKHVCNVPVLASWLIFNGSPLMTCLLIVWLYLQINIQNVTL